MSVDSPTLRHAGLARGRSSRWLAYYSASIAAWLGFVWLWVRAVRLTEVATLLVIAGLLAAAVAVIVAVTLLWVRHSVGLARRLPPRRGLPGVAPAPDRDFVGRRLDLDLEQARAAPMVVVHVDGDVKHFAARTPATRP